jgi:tripartite-type tricarboxylate transporter receptor subunit TctC
MMFWTTKGFAAGLSAALLVAFAPARVEAAWPERPVRIVVPFAAGGNTDVIARLAGEHLSKALGQQFVIENRPGAGGVPAAEAVARAEPDGYTLMIAATPQLVIAPALQKVGFDSTKDFTPIKNVGTNPFVMVVHQSVPAKDLAELIAYGGTNKGKLSYASAGPGSISHLASAMLFHRAGIEATHVPYRGNAPALNDVIAGHVSLIFANLSEALAHAANPNVRLLAVSSKARISQLPAVPTVAESGFADFEAITWNGLIGPKGVPAEIVRQIEGSLAQHLTTPAVGEKLRQLGVEPDLGTSSDYAERIRRELPVWAEAVKAAGLSPKQEP